MEPYKGHEDLVRALAQLAARGGPSCELRLIGDGGQRASLEALVRQLGLQESVVFTGALPPNDVAAQLARAELFVLPSRSEAFGQVVTEAMACGLPIVATAVGGVPEIVTPGAHGWLVEPGPDSLCAAIAEALALPRERLHAIGAANARYARSLFRWSEVMRRYLEVYQAVAGAGRQR